MTSGSAQETKYSCPVRFKKVRGFEYFPRVIKIEELTFEEETESIEDIEEGYPQEDKARQRKNDNCLTILFFIAIPP